MPAPNAARYARHELLINLTGGLVLVGVLVAVLGFQALERDDWVAIAGSTLWLKFFASFALGRHAHGLPGARSTGGAAKAGRKTRTA